MYDGVYKIIIIGDAGCGKTSLTQRFLTSLFKPDSSMTIGVDFEVKSLNIKNLKIKLQIWDFGGEERFRFLLPTYVKGANGGLFMYDITNYSSLAHMDDWLSIIKEAVGNDQVFPILAVGGKADLVDDREISSEEGINAAKLRGVEGFIECSSKTGENVDLTFETLTRMMLQNSNLL